MLWVESLKYFVVQSNDVFAVLSSVMLIFFLFSFWGHAAGHFTQDITTGGAGLSGRRSSLLSLGRLSISSPGLNITALFEGFAEVACRQLIDWEGLKLG